MWPTGHPFYQQTATCENYSLLSIQGVKNRDFIFKNKKADYLNLNQILKI